MHYNYFRHCTIHSAIYTFQSPQNEREDAYRHKHGFLYVYFVPRVYKHGIFVQTDGAAAAALVDTTSYTYPLRTMNYIMFTRSNQARYHLQATSASKMTTK